MKTFSFFAACMLMAIALKAAQQQKTVAIDRPAEPNMVFDDDGGKVQIVPADLSAFAAKKFHGGAVMASVQQVSIFLGSGWGDNSIRARQTSLQDLVGSGADAQVVEMKAHNVKVLRAAPVINDFGRLSRPLNDLDIQRKLNDMLQMKAIPAPVASTVYVVFLGPGTVSTLGESRAGIDYAAYHNVVNLAAGEVRYVVVPFNQDMQRHRSAAARAFAETALNPNGRGWF